MARALHPNLPRRGPDRGITSVARRCAVTGSAVIGFAVIGFAVIGSALLGLGVVGSSFGTARAVAVGPTIPAGRPAGTSARVARTAAPVRTAGPAAATPTTTPPKPATPTTAAPKPPATAAPASTAKPPAPAAAPPAPTAKLTPTVPASTTPASTTLVATTRPTVTTRAAGTQRATATTAPRARVGGDGVTGFDRMSPVDWPHLEEVVIVRPKATSIGIYRSTADPGPRLRFDDRKTVYGKLALLAIDRRDGFWRVALPVRPNGTTGWVRESDVVHEVVPERIVIELGTNTLRLYRGDRTVIETKVATGTGGTPTPQGLFFVKESVPQKNPNGAYGPIALGLSGFSEALKRFGGGSAIIAIHGTNAPGSIGRAASHGCIRLPNSVITELARVVKLGTPVEIVMWERDLPADRRRYLAGEPVASLEATASSDDAPAEEPRSTQPLDANSEVGPIDPGSSPPSSTPDPALVGP